MSPTVFYPRGQVCEQLFWRVWIRNTSLSNAAIIQSSSFWWKENNSENSILYYSIWKLVEVFWYFKVTISAIYVRREQIGILHCKKPTSYHGPVEVARCWGCYFVWTSCHTLWEKNTNMGRVYASLVNRSRVRTRIMRSTTGKSNNHIP